MKNRPWTMFLYDRMWNGGEWKCFKRMDSHMIRIAIVALSIGSIVVSVLATNSADNNFQKAFHHRHCFADVVTDGRENILSRRCSDDWRPCRCIKYIVYVCHIDAIAISLKPHPFAINNSCWLKRKTYLSFGYIFSI